MAQEPNKKARQDLMAWIAVLAISITLCAILFVVFAGYLSSINKNLAIANARLATMEETDTQLLKEIQALHRQQKPELKTTH